MEQIKLDYYKNENILKAISVHMKHIKCHEDREDCKQEIWANLYAFMPLDEDEAIRLVDSSAMRFRRHYVDVSKNQYEILENDRHTLGDGNYQSVAYMGSAD